MSAASTIPVVVEVSATSTPTAATTLAPTTTATLLFSHFSPKEGTLDPRAASHVDLKRAQFERHVWFRTKLTEWTGGMLSRRPFTQKSISVPEDENRVTNAASRSATVQD
jgi:hypothetical protein